MAEIVFKKDTAPNTPSSGNVTIFAKVDGFMYSKDDTGIETVMTSAGLTQDQVLNRISLRA